MFLEPCCVCKASLKPRSAATSYPSLGTHRVHSLVPSNPDLLARRQSSHTSPIPPQTSCELSRKFSLRVRPAHATPRHAAPLSSAQVRGPGARARALRLSFLVFSSQTAYGGNSPLGKLDREHVYIAPSSLARSELAVRALYEELGGQKCSRAGRGYRVLHSSSQRAEQARKQGRCGVRCRCVRRKDGCLLGRSDSFGRNYGILMSYTTCLLEMAS